jgi:hypothetical protein
MPQKKQAAIYAFLCRTPVAPAALQEGGEDPVK